jgi:hypothetical protein
MFKKERYFVRNAFIQFHTHFHLSSLFNSEAGKSVRVRTALRGGHKPAGKAQATSAEAIP